MKKPVSVVLTAFGMSGSVFHKPLIDAHPDFELVGVVKRNPAKRIPGLEQVPVFETLDQALTQALPELVVVNTPPELHRQECHLGLKAGCHILIEKPFALSRSDAENMLQQAESVGKILTAFQNRRWDSDFLTLKQVLTEGLAGKINHAELFFNRYRPEVETLSWKEQSSHLGTGAVWNLGPHLLDQALCAFGMPEALTAFIRCVRPQARVEDFFSIHLHYPEYHVDLNASYMVPDHRLKQRIQGSAFTYEKWGMDVQEGQLKAGMSPFDADFGIEPPDQLALLKKIDPTSGNVVEKQVPLLQGNYLDFYTQLHQAIRNGGLPPVKSQEMVQVVQMLEAVYQSARQGKRINLL